MYLVRGTRYLRIIRSQKDVPRYYFRAVARVWSGENDVFEESTILLSYARCFRGRRILCNVKIENRNTRCFRFVKNSKAGTLHVSNIARV